MTPPVSRSGIAPNAPMTTGEYIKNWNPNDPLILLFRNSLFTAFAISIVLTWADALVEVMVDTLDTWNNGSAKIIGSIVVTGFSLFGVLFLTALFDFCGHKIAPSN
ncbi:hypothetical protein EhV425 [Emiliania huxleyi virus 86]|uniref:Putative membrane protein n=1 Tax=Emiliania huxleyi virus 86 (isolate United Kingdom/English Channel/1999) TaxID=654925 RepID=Q4A254_EHV8U|nr:hypothetical protein EhV425 [Emiliania huxleyi virus 86]AHA55046.1 putative membrane protein [Emiliania huxleyi virus 145]AHA56052.1 putative membrane protein [Emiliania huxleyi virus 164]CAI65852.1 putative membrane protein [Emiliania huxleyi virus 86]